MFAATFASRALMWIALLLLVVAIAFQWIA
jgi:hypothetical protein